jgi:hypothetical protein
MGATSELAAVESLLMHVLPDPMGFAERVLGELAQRLTSEPGAAGSAAGPDVVPGQVTLDHEVLVERNLLLAAALGACECWAEDAGCPVCLGKGSAGWVPPDPELYAAFVAPAAVRSGSPGQGPAPAPPTARSQRRVSRTWTAPNTADGLDHEERDEGEAS